MSFLKKLLGLEKPTEDKSTGVLLTTAHGNEELAAIVALLRAADIPFRTAEQGAGDVVRVIAGYNMYGTAIYVHEEHLETALAKSVHVYDTRGYLSEKDSSGIPVYYRSCIGSFHPDDPALAQFTAEPDKYVIEYFTEEETAHIRSLFYETEMQGMADQTVMSIINEELSYWQSGVKSPEETAKIIQSRVWIYLNE